MEKVSERINKPKPKQYSFSDAMLHRYSGIDAINITELPEQYQLLARYHRLRSPNVYAKKWGERWLFRIIKNYKIGSPEYGVQEAILLDLDYMLVLGKIEDPALAS